MDIGVLLHVGYPFMALGAVLMIIDSRKTGEAKT
jgi:hypothetical protein